MPETPTHAMTDSAVSNLPWVSVTSSNLQGVAFHEGGLFIRFGSGTIYRYTGIPETKYADAQTLYELLIEADQDEASSVGKTFNSLIRKGGAPAARVEIIDE